MRFSTRNAFYLRVSNYRVIPLFLYLDERHVDWMTDRVLQLVISDLHSKMQDLLLQDRKQKKHKVHVERGDTYQYCYFLRTTTRTEVVLLKQKTFSLRPPSPPPPPAQTKSTTRKRKNPSFSSQSRAQSSRSRTRSVSVSTNLNEGDDNEEGDEDSEIVIKQEPDQERWESASNEGEKSIKDWKPDVDVRYQGFGTSSVQLVLIVEPYPPLPASEYAPPSSRLSSRSQSLASHSRARTHGTHLGHTPTLISSFGNNGHHSSSSLSVPLDGDTNSRQPIIHTPNLRNATRSVSASPANVRNAGRDLSSTPGIGASGRSASVSAGGGGRRGVTPLFISRDTPFGEDEEDEEAHEAYQIALREGRLRLPSVLDDGEGYNGGGGVDDELWMDVPESMEHISQRLIRSSQIEEGVIRSAGGWEERQVGEESAVMGKEEPGD